MKRFFNHPDISLLSKAVKKWINSISHEVSGLKKDGRSFILCVFKGKVRNIIGMRETKYFRRDTGICQTFISGHRNPDIDSLAAATALAVLRGRHQEGKFRPLCPGIMPDRQEKQI